MPYKITSKGTGRERILTDEEHDALQQKQRAHLYKIEKIKPEKEKKVPVPDSAFLPEITGPDLDKND